MSRLNIKASEDEGQILELLGKSIPTYRQAYSDRTAWLMACLAELAYCRFNPLFVSGAFKARFLEAVTTLVDANSRQGLLNLVDAVAYDHEQEKHELEVELGFLGGGLIETFDRNGTQAILVEFEDVFALAFRGTEATSIRDIKSDMNAIRKGCISGGNVHSGFSDAFDQVFSDILDSLQSYPIKNKPLFITGHSLGGALATVAAKRLQHDGGIAACYTFGAPRVGDEDWIMNIKTPIYRLVNAADCVTMLPPKTEIVTALSWIVGFIPWVGKPLKSWLLRRFSGYLHCGDMRYLTNCAPGRFDEVKLLYSVSLLYRIKGLIFKKLPGRHFLSDHSIRVYREKLKVIALRRNL